MPKDPTKETTEPVLETPAAVVSFQTWSEDPDVNDIPAEYIGAIKALHGSKKLTVTEWDAIAWSIGASEVR